MPTEAPIVVWFRQDLRLADNPALDFAARSGRRVAPLYVLDQTPGGRALGGASQWWLDRSLQALGADLEAMGARLILRRGPSAEVVSAFAAELNAGSVVWNRLYDAVSMDRDSRLKSALTQAGLECRSFNASLLSEPWTIRTTAGGPFKVFTAYWRVASRAFDLGVLADRPSVLRSLSEPHSSEAVRKQGLAAGRLDWARGFGDWRPGESGALEALDRFLDGAADRYGQDRNRPDLVGTSRLSPHLHFGEIGPRQVWRAVVGASERGKMGHAQADAFLKELGWREFNHHLLHHAPDMPRVALNRRFDAFAWRRDEAEFEAWARGLTGYPIVDAGMRELWSSGWMHNRVRMIVASFLTKDLMIDWREGERWFWDTLVDADLANNTANWQWVAGAGADAAPYFRVFNPALQGERFDPLGDYVRQWAPELSRLPAPAIHRPWTLDARVLAAAGVKLGETYPWPVVEHGEARRRALEFYRRLPEEAPLDARA